MSFFEFNYMIMQAYDFWTLNKKYGCIMEMGGDDQWLLDDNQNKIPVAGQNGKTPTINKDGYWEIDGETIKGEDGQPIKAVGKDGANGADGLGIKSLTLSPDGELVVTMSDNSISNLGNIKGEKG